MTNESEDVHSFKSGDMTYEIFISPDNSEEYFEIYEKENPKEGLTFNSRKQLISFVNLLTDVVESEVIENGNS